MELISSDPDDNPGSSRHSLTKSENYDIVNCFEVQCLSRVKVLRCLLSLLEEINTIIVEKGWSVTFRM